MGKAFEQRHDAEVPARPEEVWAAIATGPGIDSWFMGHTELRPEPGGKVHAEFGDLDITTCEPGRRFGYRSPERADGRFIAYEFLIEARSGGSTVLRTVTSGFIPGVDWADEYEAMALGTEMYFATLVEYLGHFGGRPAVPVTASGPAGTNWGRDRGLLCRALGLPGDGAAGDKVQFVADEVGSVDGVLYFANANSLCVRTPDALYRFIRGFGKPVVAAHKLFAESTENAESLSRDWEAWLARVLVTSPPR
jgi:uncharacterized protein YndB with AHSA1/START domain